MPANWYLPISATATLTVGIPQGDVVDFRVPPGAEQGDIIGPTEEPVAIGVRNVGSLAGVINLRIRDLDGDTRWIGTITLDIDEYGWVYPALNYPMPAHDFNLRAEAYRDSVIDSYQDQTIILILKVDTDITLTLAPSAIQPGTTYHYQGRLTRIDTGAGLAGMTIIARRYENEVWEEIGTGTTDATGNYDISATAPIDIGEFNCVAAFPGVHPFTASAAHANLGVGMAVIEPIWIAAGAATLGVALVMLGISQ